jgi:hypothetical protein
MYAKIVKQDKIIPNNHDPNITAEWYHIEILDHKDPGITDQIVGVLPKEPVTDAGRQVYAPYHSTNATKFTFAAGQIVEITKHLGVIEYRIGNNRAGIRK